MSEKVQVLVAALNEKDHSLLDRMNIQSDVIVGNQCDKNLVETGDYHGHTFWYYNFAERGVGLNRNTALMRATGDLCILADDDMRFFDGYPAIVENAYYTHPDADVIIFNLIARSPSERVNQKEKRITLLNYMNYGAARITFRRKYVSYCGVYFNQNFGGGTPHSSGEDSLFLRELLRKGAKVIAVPVALAELCDARDSTWFHGYNNRFFFDKGVFLGTAHPILGALFGAYLILRHKKYRGVGHFTELMKGIQFVRKKEYQR